jgi:hypothetical protein
MPEEEGASEDTAQATKKPLFGRFSYADAIVFLVAESIAMPLNVAAGAAAVQRDAVGALVGWGVGLPLAYFGWAFPRWRDRLTESTRELIQRRAINWAPVAIFLAFAYVVGPNIYQRAVPPSPQPAARASEPDFGLITALRAQLTEKDKELASARTQLGALSTKLTSTEQMSDARELALQRLQHIPTFGADAEVDIIKRLPSAKDHERLAEAFHDFSKFLDNGEKLWMSINLVANQIALIRQDGSIIKNIVDYDRLFADAVTASKGYYDELGNIKQQWKYYERQIGYIAGDDPENKVSIPLNAINEFKIYFDRWWKIQNKDDNSVKDLLSYPQNTLDKANRSFLDWRRGCEARLGLLKDAL